MNTLKSITHPEKLSTLTMEWLYQRIAHLNDLRKSHGSRLVLAISFILVAALSFEAGMLQKSLVQTKPMVIRVPVDEGNRSPVRMDTSAATPLAPATQSSQTDNKACAWVGSKKSNKYHHPTSRCAQQIKPENKICFVSPEAAQAKKYVPGCLEP